MGVRVFISAGDASGDAIGAALVETLRERHPDWCFVGLAGEALLAAGVERVADQAELAVGGFGSLLGSAGRIVSTWRRMTRAIERNAPDLVVLIDSGGFHLPLARAVRRRCSAPILYYVPPQVWAWRSHRLRTLAERVDRIALILPDEPDFYAERGVRADFVGHPILDRAVATGFGAKASEAARSRLGLPLDAPVLGLFPGSRRNEIARHLPIQLAAARRLRDEAGQHERLICVLVRAPSVTRESLDAILERSAEGLSVVTTDALLDGIDACDVALAKPGTVTLELTLRDRPMVVMGRAGRIAAALARRRVRVRWLALPNLIADHEIVPECLQEAAEPDRLVEALAPLFPGFEGEARGESTAARSQRAGFAKVRERLGMPGASERVAHLVEEMLGTDQA